MNNEESLSNENEDRIQRALNEAKKRELEEKYGADFHDKNSKLPPEVEGQWLDYIEQFEQQFQNAERTTVRAFTGNPNVKPLAEISPGHLEEELERIVGIMAEHEVILDFCAPTPIEEQYRFITEELLNEEMDEMRIPGMQHRFIYEEFHPNDEMDVRDATDHVLSFFLDKDPDMYLHYLDKTEFRNEYGEPMTREQLMERINRFYEGVLVFLNKSIENIRCTVDGDTATAEADVEWNGLVDDSTRRAADGIKEIAHSGVAKLRLKRSEYGGWDVTQFSVPGFEW